MARRSASGIGDGMNDDLQATIEAGWDARDSVSTATHGALRDAVEAVIAGLDSGRYRVAEKLDGAWQVHQWLKKAVLLSFRLHPNREIAGAPGSASWWDKVPSKFEGMDSADFE